MTDDTPPVSFAALREALGITERRADYWRTKGWIGGTPRNGRTGSGYAITMTPDDAAHFRRVAALVRAGITPSRAADYARDLQTAGRAVIGPSLTIVETTP